MQSFVGFQIFELHNSHVCEKCSKIMELENCFPVTFSALGINSQKFTIFPLRFISSRAVYSLIMSRLILIRFQQKHCLASVSFLLSAILNCSLSALNITGLWLTVPRKRD